MALCFDCCLAAGIPGAGELRRFSLLDVLVNNPDWGENREAVEGKKRRKDVKRGRERAHVHKIFLIASAVIADTLVIKSRLRLILIGSGRRRSDTDDLRPKKKLFWFFFLSKRKKLGSQTGICRTVSNVIVQPAIVLIREICNFITILNNSQMY